MLNETILIVEDDGILVAQLQDRLTGLGYTVLEPVDSGEAAIAAVKAQPPDIVLMDIMLAGAMDGITAAGRIQSAADIPIVYLTGYSQDLLLQQAKVTAPYGYLVKPVSERELAATLEMALYRHTLDRRLRESEERYKALFDRSLNLIFISDFEGRFTDANAAVLNRLGYTREEIRSLDFTSLLSEDQSHLAFKTLQEIRETGIQKDRIELRLRHKNGSDVYVETKGSAILNKGTFVAIQSIAWDVTERKQSEEALRKIEAKYQSLFEEMACGFALHQLVCDDDGKPVDYITREVNREYERLLNVKKENVIGKRAYETTPNLDKEWLNIFSQVVFTRQPCRYEQYAANVDKWFEGSAFSPRPDFFAATFVDITARKRSEEALRESESRFRTMFQEAPLGIALIDSYTGHIYEVNQRFAEIAGRAQAEMKTIDWMSITHPDDVREDLDQIARLNAGEISRFHMNKRYLQPSGSVVWISMTIAPLQEPNLRYKRHLCMIEDITEHKRGEEALRAALEGKEVLLKEVHHRVKNNLTAIIGLLELQRETVTDPAAMAQFRDLEGRIRSMALVHETLYHSESLARVNLQAYLETLITQLRTSLAPRGDVCLSVATAGVEMGLDTAIPCGLILNELITNAFKYAFPGDQPRPGEKACEITVSAEWDSGAGDDGVYTLTVADNGVGLPADLDWATTKTLGLRLVRMLGQYQLKGQIELDRANGTSFRLVFASRQREKR